MDNKSNDKRVKTQMVPAIHNKVSLPIYLKDEDGEPIEGATLRFDLYNNNKNTFLKSYKRVTDENGKGDLTLNLYSSAKIVVVFEGDEEYEKCKLNTIIRKPHPDEIAKKNNDTFVEYRSKRKREKDEIELEKKKEKQAILNEEFWEKQKERDQKGPEGVAIELKNVSLSFKIGNDKIDNLKEYVIRTIKRTKEKKRLFKATDDVSFKIYKGEKVGLIGYNGAGKSTILKIISKVYKPDEGEVIVNGNIAPLLSLGAGFDKNYSGRENIFLNGSILGYDEEFLKNKYQEILDFSELHEFIEFPVKNYSAGMLAKLGFSIATIVEPDILIVDEVLGVGDINFRKKSSEKLKSLMDSDTTVLFVSHSIHEIRNICEKAIWIEKGKIKEIGEVNDICDKYIEEAENASIEQTKKIKPKKFK